MTKRRKFLQLSLASAAGLVSVPVVFARYLPKGLPLLAQQDPYKLFDKHADMVLLNDRPWNMEAQAHLLDDEVTPADRMFIRNNGLTPNAIDPDAWTLSIEGESVKEPKVYTLAELKSRFQKYTYQVTLECGGNGRSEFNPPAKGNQWTVGAVSCAKWGGLRLADLLDDAAILDTAVYVGYYAADDHLSRDPEKEPISRGIPIAKALLPETLVAYQMNDEDIPLAHGHPLRLIAGGWPASASGKWINKLVIRNRVHDGAKMGGSSYRVPCESVAPGTVVADDDMCIIESMPVKSLITTPKTGAIISADQTIKVGGHAWAGELEVQKMQYSIDFGATWQDCQLSTPANRLAWQRWNAEVKFPEKGYYEVWSRATDENGVSQPMVLPGWNPKGYLNNACHRIAIMVS